MVKTLPPRHSQGDIVMETFSREPCIKQQWDQGGRNHRIRCQWHWGPGRRHRHSWTWQRHGHCAGKTNILAKTLLATRICFRLTPTVWTSRVCSSERIASFLGTSAANQGRPEMAGFKKLSYHTSVNNRRGWNLIWPSGLKRIVIL